MRAKQPVHKLITNLKRERSDIEQRLTQLRSTIDRLIELAESKVQRHAQSQTRQLSSAGRDAISRAAKKRWAEYRRSKGRRAESHA